MSECATCQIIACPDTSNFSYTLEGSPPIPPAPAPPIPPTDVFSNNEVQYQPYPPFLCPMGTTFSYLGTPPNWITHDILTNTFTGSAGIFFGVSRDAATALAQTKLELFVLNEGATGKLTCA